MDSVERQKRLDFVKQQLASYGGQKITGNADYTFISCPYHNEKTPSARIFHSPTSHSPGYLKCYGCGAKEFWDKWAPQVGLKPFKRGKPEDSFSNLTATIKSLSLVDNEDEEQEKERFKFKKLKKGEKWRHIKTDLLIKIEAKLCKIWSDEYQSWSGTRLYLPCNVRGRTVGYIKARLEKHETYPSYLNASGSWSKTHGLFPFDYAIELMERKKSTTVILVEGPRDALRLLQMGIPAMCILGTQSFSKNKAKLLELAGVETVVLFMDGDGAGIKATKMIKPILKGFVTVKVLKLWAMKGSPWKKVKNHKKPKEEAARLGLELWDPGNVSKDLLKRIKEKYYAR